MAKYDTKKTTDKQQKQTYKKTSDIQRRTQPNGDRNASEISETIKHTKRNKNTGTLPFAIPPDAI